MKIFLDWRGNARFVKFLNLPLSHNFFESNNVVFCVCHFQSDEARIAKEVEAHEKRIRKELEKQDVLRRKVLHCSKFAFDMLNIWY